MEPFNLAEITTRDNLIHQGICFEPKKKSESAILYIHGLGSTFYSNIGLISEIVSVCNYYGYGFASFNNRGHDTLAGIKKIDPDDEKGYKRIAGGSAHEVFADSIYDIDAGITYLIHQGYSQIFLCGHSSGANKACLYAGSQNDPRVTGVILSSPVSDRLAPQEKRSWTMDIGMKFLYYMGLGDMLVWNSRMTITPKRYISLYTPHSLEDVFSYGDKQPIMSIFSRIHIPLLILLGDHDEYLDRPAVNVMAVYDSLQQSKRYERNIVQAGLHSFQGKEKEIAKKIVNWIHKIPIK